MESLKEAIVINEKGFKAEYVIGDPETGIPMYYTLQEGESLIFEDIATALRMLKPQWDGEQWIETATEEEIEAARPPVCNLPQPKPLDQRIGDLETVVDIMLGSIENEKAYSTVLAQQANVLLQFAGQRLELSENEMMQIADLYPAWEPGRQYTEGAILRHGVNTDGETQLWRVIQTHTSQEDWTPPTAVSLFVAIGFTDEGFQIWTQPLGAHDAYQKGDIVYFNCKLWVSEVDNNVWQPGVFGWREKGV